MPRSLPPPTKKRKLLKDNGVQKTIVDLEQTLSTALQSPTGSLNPLADLLDLLFSTEEPADTGKAIYALYRVFVLIIGGERLAGGSGEEEKAVRAWIWERLNAYVEYLGALLKDSDKTLRNSALQILFSLQRHLTTLISTPSQPQFHINHFRKVVSDLLLCPASKRPQNSEDFVTDDGVISPDIRDLFVDTWFTVHDDVRWFFLRECAIVLTPSNVSSNPHIPSNLLSILEKLTTFPTTPSELNAWWAEELGTKPPKPKSKSKGSESPYSSEDEDEDENADGEDDWRKFFDEPKNDDKNKKGANIKTARLHKMSIHQSLHSLSSHRAVFTRAWLTLLPYLSSDTPRKDARANGTKDGKKALIIRALNVMHRGVMPHLTRPVLVMDWIGASVDYGGTVGLLALNALFILMKEYNLDYPSFYTRLYGFLDRDVLHLKHRARFFRMTELFLSSTHLPAMLLASFIKRLARLSLTAPPAAIVMVIPFTYNVLKKHPALMVMIHRDVDLGIGELYTDPFLPDEVNPNLTNALDSSLWELYSHRTHYHAGVSTLAKIFEEAFTKPGYSMEDFLDHTYATLFEADASRKIKKEPALGMDIELLPSGKTKKVELFPSKTQNDEGDATGTVDQVDIVTELWTFG